MNIAKTAIQLVGGAALVCAVHQASAEPIVDPQKARAQALYDEALRKMDAQRLGEACPMLEDVLAAVPELVGAKLTLADCYARTGRLASSYRLYSSVEEEAARAGQDARRKKAAEKARALEPRLARLRFLMPESLRAAPGLLVKLDGEALAGTALSAATPVDLGSHSIEVLASGRAPLKRTINVSAEGAALDVALEWPPSERAAEREASGASGAGEAPASSASRDESTRVYWSSARIAGVVGMGLGAIGLGIGVGYGAKAIGAKNESDAGHCNASSLCDAEGLALRASSLSAGNVATGMFVAGGALLAGSTLLFVLAPGKARAKSPESAELAVGPSSIALRGTW